MTSSNFKCPYKKGGQVLNNITWPKRSRNAIPHLHVHSVECCTPQLSVSLDTAYMSQHLHNTYTVRTQYSWRHATLRTELGVNSLRETAAFYACLLHFHVLCVDRVTLCEHINTSVQGGRLSGNRPLDTRAQVNTDSHEHAQHI